MDGELKGKDILAMKPGPEMNAAVAEFVMGEPEPSYICTDDQFTSWAEHDIEIRSKKGNWTYMPPLPMISSGGAWFTKDFSEDTGPAWEVVEKVTAPPTTPEAARHAANTRFAFMFEAGNVWAMSAQEAAEFICRSALLAVCDG